MSILLDLESMTPTERNALKDSVLLERLPHHWGLTLARGQELEWSAEFFLTRGESPEILSVILSRLEQDTAYQALLAGHLSRAFGLPLDFEPEPEPEDEDGPHHPRLENPRFTCVLRERSLLVRFSGRMPRGLSIDDLSWGRG